jgi:hypothetical protein
MPYKEEEDDITSEGVFGKVVDTVNTLKDMYFLVRSSGTSASPIIPQMVPSKFKTRQLQQQKNHTSLRAQRERQNAQNISYLPRNMNVGSQQMELTNQNPLHWPSKQKDTSPILADSTPNTVNIWSNSNEKLVVKATSPKRVETSSSGFDLGVGTSVGAQRASLVPHKSRSSHRSRPQPPRRTLVMTSNERR